MRQTVEGLELWTVQDIIKSGLRDSEKFTITVGELRKMHKRHCEALMELKTTQMDLEIAKSQIKEQKRFVVYA